MNLILFIFMILMGNHLNAQDNEIYIDQVGATFNLDVVQLGSGNIIGGTDGIAGTMTPLDLDGLTMTLDINQIGDGNEFLGDITSDTFTGFFEFDGDNNIFDIQVDPANVYGANSGNFLVDVEGSGNTFDLAVATSDLASALDLDWLIYGDSNTITATIDYDQATNYMEIDGNSNTVTFDGDGYNSAFFSLDQTGDSRTFDVQQQSTLASDWLQIISNGNNGTVCVIQSDGGTITTC